MDWKLTVINKVKNLLESTKFHIIGNTIVSLLLYGFETLMELELKCPCDQNSNVYYIFITFVNPTVVLFILGFMLHCDLLKKYCKHKKLSCSTVLLVFNALTPGMVWIVLLFLDGDYYACSNLIGKNETECELKCNENPGATQANHCIISQLIGGVVLIVFLIALLFVYCLRCKLNDRKIEYKVEYENMCEKETESLMREKLEHKAHEDTEKQCENTMKAIFPANTQSPQRRPADDIPLTERHQIPEG